MAQGFPLGTLEAQFVRLRGHDLLHVDDLPSAQGVMFLCPLCYARNGGFVGTHMVVCWFKGRGVPDSEFPRPGRWTASGTGLADLTLAPSVYLKPVTGDAGCGWHGFVQNGVAR